MKIVSFLSITALLLTVTSCTSPKVISEQIMTVAGVEKPLMYRVQNVLIKNDKGRRVYSGTVEIYKDKIFYKKPGGDNVQIPNDQIHSIYGKYRGGGAMTFTAVMAVWWGLISLEAARIEEDSWGGLGLALAVYYGTPILGLTSIGLGSALGNFKVLLYHRDRVQTDALNYHDLIERIPASRADGRAMKRTRDFLKNHSTSNE